MRPCTEAGIENDDDDVFSMEKYLTSPEDVLGRRRRRKIKLIICPKEDLHGTIFT
jgi:hypothetical protein